MLQIRTGLIRRQRENIEQPRDALYEVVSPEPVVAVQDLRDWIAAQATSLTPEETLHALISELT